jgi:predicted O-methyltransferase YrrM
MMITRLFFFIFLMCNIIFAEEIKVALDEYLQLHKYEKIEGHCCKDQTNQPEYFKNLLEENQHKIQKIVEIGFNAGHSSELFLLYHPTSTVVSFDIMKHSYVRLGKKYIDTKYPNRHSLVPGNSLSSVPDFIEIYPEIKFDLIFIDGGHSYTNALNDIQNCRGFAHKNTIVVIDDYCYPTVKQAFDECVALGICSEGQFFTSKHKKWVQCRYLF